MMYNKKTIFKMILNEIDRIQDFEYFVNEYIGVELYKHQKDMCDLIECGNKFNIIGKPRQCGVSQLIAWKLAHLLLLGKSINIGFIGCNLHITHDMRDRVYNILTDLVDDSNINSSKIRIECLMANVHFGTPNNYFFKAKTFDLIIFDEFSFYADDFSFNDSLSSLNANGRVIITTGNYRNNYYAAKLLDGLNANRIILNWYDIDEPNYLSGVAASRRYLSKSQFESEYEF